jgi:hypothetical protein
VSVVAYVGNFTRPWCTEVHVAASLEELGHRVVRLQENEVDWPAFPDVVDESGADLWMWTRTWPVPHDACLDAIGKIRAAGVPSVFYHLDRWWGLERESQIHTEPFFRLDLVVSPDDQAEKWAAAGVNHLWMPPAVYAAECGPVAPTAKVVVGDSCLVGEPRRYISDRVPETVGRGGLLIHPAVAGVTDGALYTDREHLVTYPLGDFDKMLRLVDYYLEQDTEREAIRAAGRAHVAAHHTYAHRMEAVLAAVPALADA